MMYVIFLIRTDTTKEGSGMFVAVYDSEKSAKDISDSLNTPGVLEESCMYVVHTVKVNAIDEGRRIYNLRKGY